MSVSSTKVDEQADSESGSKAARGDAEVPAAGAKVAERTVVAAVAAAAAAAADIDDADSSGVLAAAAEERRPAAELPGPCIGVGPLRCSNLGVGPQARTPSLTAAAAEERTSAHRTGCVCTSVVQHAPQQIGATAAVPLLPGK